MTFFFSDIYIICIFILFFMYIICIFFIYYFVIFSSYLFDILYTPMSSRTLYCSLATKFQSRKQAQASFVYKLPMTHVHRPHVSVVSYHYKQMRTYGPTRRKSVGYADNVILNFSSIEMMRKFILLHMRIHKNISI